VIVRATDASLHNFIANHPAVKPTFGYANAFADLSPLLEYPDQYIMLSDGKGAASIFEWSAPFVRQGHSLFLPDSRGKDGLESARAMLGWMFDYGAKMLWGMTPLDNRAALMFNRLIGFKAGGVRIDAADREVRLFYMEK
jgi:hypothetical protein